MVRSIITKQKRVNKMNNHFDTKIVSTKVVYGAGNERFIRVFFEDSFQDINASIFEEWKEVTGNYE